MSDPRKKYKSSAERQTERRVRNVMKGLTTQGKPRRRHPHFPNRELAREHKNKQNLANYYQRARENKAKGLRVDGKPFRRRQALHAWQHIRESMQIGPVSFEDFGTANSKEIYA